jgi:hypothetical protein
MLAAAGGKQPFAPLPPPAPPGLPTHPMPAAAPIPPSPTRLTCIALSWNALCCLLGFEYVITYIAARSTAIFFCSMVLDHSSDWQVLTQSSFLTGRQLLRRHVNAPRPFSTGHWPSFQQDQESVAATALQFNYLKHHVNTPRPFSTGHWPSIQPHRESVAATAFVIELSCELW